MFRILTLSSIFLLSAVSGSNYAEAIKPPAPSLTISFERQNVRQGDCVNVELLISNDSDYEILKPSLEIVGPSFVKWYTESCHEKNKEVGSMVSSPAVRTLSLDPIKAKSILTRKLHLHTDQTIEVGDYNALFVVQFHWSVDKTGGSSFVSAEKPIKVSFLGNESVAGIPLALAGFIVPGLVFWWIIKLFGASWSIEALSEQMIYSVLVSIGLVFFGTWLGFSDISSGISVERLLRLALAGLFVGVAVGGVDLLIRKVRAGRAATREAARLERQIKPVESEFSLLGKLLELPVEAQLSKPLIRLKDNQQYVGALGAHSPFVAPSGQTETIYSLVGSFSIDESAADDADQARLKQLRETDQFRALVTLAKEKGLLSCVEEVQKVNEEGELELSGHSFMQWKGEEVLSVSQNQDGWDQPALK